jgi:hypothetical protein
MHRRIIGFHQDPEQHWVAELECGHGQHVRHDPPWQVRAWVLTEATRRGQLGSMLDCRLCESPPHGAPGNAPSNLSPEAKRAYLDARLQGLCHEGALEIALRQAP